MADTSRSRGRGGGGGYTVILGLILMQRHSEILERGLPPPLPLGQAVITWAD